jgi:GDSL-like Lipase/Acylhydrolase family
MHNRGSNRLLMMAWPLCLVLAACGSEESESPSPPGPVKTAAVMPLGDSITESAAGMQTYRYFLWHLVRNAGYRIDFVGSKRGAFGGPPANTDFDMDHEGHWGWRADQVLARLSDGAAAAASPDIVLLHLGHNDLCQGQDVAGTVNDIAAVIDVLRSVNATVAILLAQNIPSTLTCHALKRDFIAALPGLAAAKHTAESPVVVVDQHTGFDPVTMTWDGEHPNATGASLMADRWFAALVPLLDAFLARP